MIDTCKLQKLAYLAAGCYARCRLIDVRHALGVSMFNEARVLRVVIVVLLACMMFGAAEKKETVHELISAREIRLVDEKGEERGSLSIHEGKPMLLLEQGDKDGRASQVTPEGVFLKGPNGFCATTLKGVVIKTDTGRAVMNVGEKGPAIYTASATDDTLWSASNEADGMTVRNGISVVDKNGDPRASILMNEKGQPSISMVSSLLEGQTLDLSTDGIFLKSARGETTVFPYGYMLKTNLGSVTLAADKKGGLITTKDEVSKKTWTSLQE
jgi:hypothetical protein